MKKLEIEIPEGQEIDWQESAKQEKIVFKERQLTYEDVCDKLFAKGHFYTNENGAVCFTRKVNKCPNNAYTTHQLECLLAKNKLANVARYLNDDWDYSNYSHQFIIWIDNKGELSISESGLFTERATVIFKSKELAKKAISILGEEIVKLALTPLF